jgi:hypothetical protein
MDILRPVLDQIGKLWGRLDMMPVVRWGTVTQASPLRVILDGDMEALPFSPQNTVPGLVVGNRVVCVEQHRRVLVVQVAGKIVEWTAPTFQNSFGNGAAPARVEVTPYRVEFSGSLYRSSAPTSYTTAFTLPPHIPRPSAQLRWAGRDDVEMWVAVTADGQVQVRANDSLSSGIGYMLDGLGYAY